MFGDILISYEAQAYEYAEVVSERASFLFIHQDVLAHLMQRNYSLTMNYMGKVTDKFKSLEIRYMNMVSKDVKSRLMYCFKEWARKEGKRFGNKVVVKNNLTHSDLANFISTSRQTVTIILNELKESGEIRYNRKEIEFSELMLAS
jgi:CRP/FNR family transcriptional regulator, cyclic AMP receptor protein